MRHALIILSMLLTSISAAVAQVSIGISVPGISIGINMPVYPELVQVPGYPVYYAPRQNSNFFFYDGMYWVYQGDNWYASSWYDGPWGMVSPAFVPLFVLRIPVRYYRAPPAYFRGWRPDAPPRWGDHWGREWERDRSGWNRWDHKSSPRPAPLPTYQRQYSGERYPDADQQRTLRNQRYQYQPREAVARQHYERPANSRSNSNEAVREQRRPEVQDQRRSPQPGPVQREQSKQPQGSSQREQPMQQQAPRQQNQDNGAQGGGRDKGASGKNQGNPEQRQNAGQERSQDKGQDRGHGRD